FRYSARTRVIIEEKSVRKLQRMKNPAAREPREQVTGDRSQEPETKADGSKYATGVVRILWKIPPFLKIACNLLIFESCRCATNRSTSFSSRDPPAPDAAGSARTSASPSFFENATLSEKSRVICSSAHLVENAGSFPSQMEIFI